MPDIVILIGLPASGKSTFFRERFSASHAHVSKDNFPKHRRPARRQEREIREALAADRSVVVDNTNASVDERAAVIAIGRELGTRILGYVFETDVPGCRERNGNRKGAACVPLVALYDTAKRYQAPRMEEGFDELWTVRLAEAGFDVQHYTGESE